MRFEPRSVLNFKTGFRHFSVHANMRVLVDEIFSATADIFFEKKYFGQKDN